MNSTQTIGACVLLAREGRVALQLRDDLLKWGIFGGLVEDGEEPLDAAVREIGEELTITLDPSRLAPLRVFVSDRYISHMFYYRLRSELDRAVLTEGIRFGLFGRGDICGDEIVPWHLHMLTWYWEVHRPGWQERASPSSG